MTGKPSILDAVDDRAIFAPWFKDRATWAAWRAFLAVLFGLALAPDQLALFQQCTGRSAPLAGGYLECWLICGRRAGKSFTLALIAVFLACFVDWSSHLVPGETGRIVIISADRRQSRVIFGYLLGFLKNIPMLAGMVVRETLESVDLANGLSIEIQAASYRTVRGYSLVAALCDEIAFWSTDDGAANPDQEIIRALRPALASIPGSMLLVASSPYAEAGALWSAYKRHHGKDDSAVLTWQAPTRTMNPSIPESVVLEALATDEAAAQSEYLARFRSDVSTFISRELIEAAVDRGIVSRPPMPGHTYFCFADGASGINATGDWFTAAIGHAENDLLIVDHLFARKPPFSASDVLHEICDLALAYSCREIVSDRVAQGFMAAQIAARGLSWRAIEYDKSQLYLTSLPLFGSGKIRLLDNGAGTVGELAVNQFLSLERRAGSFGGRDRVDARGGKPEDLANAIVGLVSLMHKPVTGAEAFLEFMRRQCVAAGLSFPRNNVDMDAARAPGPEFGWNLTTAPLLKLYVPPVIAAEGKVGNAGVRFDPAPFVDVTRGTALRLLQHPSYRALNETLAQKLEREDAV